MKWIKRIKNLIFGYKLWEIENYSIPQEILDINKRLCEVVKMGYIEFNRLDI